MPYGTKIMGGIRKVKEWIRVKIVDEIEELNSPAIQYSDHVLYNDPDIHYRNTLQGQKPSINRKL